MSAIFHSEGSKPVMNDLFNNVVSEGDNSEAHSTGCIGSIDSIGAIGSIVSIGSISSGAL